MLTMYIITIAFFAVTVVGFIYFSYKGYINKKESLAGIMASVVVQVLTSTITNVVNNTGVNIYITLVAELIIFCLLSIASLYIVFNYILKKDKPNKYSYSGFGFGFGLSVEIIQILPIVLNSFTYYNAISDGSIYELLAETLTTTEIDEIVAAFNAIPAVYYIALCLQAIMLFVGFAYIFDSFMTKNKGNIIEAIGLLFAMNFFMFIVPNFGSYNWYWLCVAGYIVLSVICTYGLIRKQLIEFKK